MKLFKSESIYDAETQQWIEKFWINGEEVDGETYFSMIDLEKSIEDKKLEEENKYDSDNCKYVDTDECCKCGECSSCEDIEEIVCDDNCEECEIHDELCKEIKLIEEYAEKIENIECTCGCKLRNILYEFLMVSKQIGYENCKGYIKGFVDEV